LFSFDFDPAVNFAPIFFECSLRIISAAAPPVETTPTAICAAIAKQNGHMGSSLNSLL
jgi:hypothetical protein